MAPEPRDPGRPVAYRFLPIMQRDDLGRSYLAGHTVMWDPARVRMVLRVSLEAMNRDLGATTYSPYFARAEGKLLAPHPGDPVRQVVAKHPGGLAYFNANAAGTQVHPLIADGRLLAKPRGARAALQHIWEPLAGPYPFLLDHPAGRVELRELSFVDGCISPDQAWVLGPGVCGLSAPWLLRSGAYVPLQNPPAGQTPLGGQELFPAGSTVPAAMCAMGITPEGMAVRVSLVGDVADPQRADRLPTERDLARCLLDMAVADALFTGASGDVQYFDAGSCSLVVAAERAKDPERRWVLAPGQTERGLTAVVSLVER